MEMKELQAQHDKKIQEIRVKFFTNISHEFRNPLTLILGTIEKMRQDKKFDDDSSLVLIRNVKRLLKLVDDVMDFKKVESGEPRLQVQKEDLYSFMRQIVDDYKTLSYVKHKNFEVYIPQGEQWGWIDEEVVTKIILNLLNSAFKYSKENSTIQLGVLAEDEVYLPAFKWKHTIQITDIRSISFVFIYEIMALEYQRILSVIYLTNTIRFKIHITICILV